MKTLLLAILLLLIFSPPQDLESKIKTFRNHKRFSVNYDKFKDESWIDVGPFVVGGDMRYFMTSTQLHMTARLRYSGTTIKKPVNNFVLWFQATGKDWTFLKDRDLYALIDGERFDLGEGRHDGDVRHYGGVSETLGFLIPAEVFQKMGKAEKTELKIGRIELTLKDEHKEAFRDLYSLSK